MIVSGLNLTELIFRVQTAKLWSLRPAIMVELSLMFNGLFVRIFSINVKVGAVTRM